MQFASSAANRQSLTPSQSQFSSQSNNKRRREVGSLVGLLCVCAPFEYSIGGRRRAGECHWRLLTWDAGLVRTLELVGRTTRTGGEIYANIGVARVGVLATVEHT